MKIAEICINTYSINNKLYYYGKVLFDCGLQITGIHFFQTNNSVHVNYPAVQDNYGKFHPSFYILNQAYDDAVKRILQSAWNIVKNNDLISIYGYLLTDCCKELNELSAEDFEWFDDKQEQKYQLSVLRPLTLKADLKIGKKNTATTKFAYACVYLNDIFKICNLTITMNFKKDVIIYYPLHDSEASVSFIFKEDKDLVETYILEKLEEFCDSPTQTSDTECMTDYKKLFHVLWNASDNGYILQAQIRKVLEQNQIDWKRSFHVERISELVQKIDFMSSRRLESSPEHYVDWVAISHEKDPEPVVVKNNTLLSESIKEELHNALSYEYKSSGKIDLSTVIPYLADKYPEILEKLPKVKLKAILQCCDFIQFEGGPMPPIYIHIISENAISIEQTEQAAGTWTFSTSDNTNTSITSVCTNTAEKKPVRIIEEYDRLAKSNPFMFVPNIRLVMEQNIPELMTVPKTSIEIMNKFETYIRHGSLDSMDLEIVYWLSKLQYSKSTFLYNLIIGNFIKVPAGTTIDKNKLNRRLKRLQAVNLISFYRLRPIDENGNILPAIKDDHRILMLSARGRTQLRAIGRQSDFNYFMPLENIETILNKLSVNQWFTKFITVFQDVYYHLNFIVTAKIREDDAARIPLAIKKNGISIFIKAFRRGEIFKDDARSGEFASWINRVSNLLDNYKELYIRDRWVEFKKKPKLVFLCEDLEHCKEVHALLLEVTAKIGKKTILDNLWFSEDLSVYNDFKNAHFTFNHEGKCIPASIEEFLKPEISEA